MQNFFLEKFKIRNVKVYLYVQIIGYKSTFHMITSQDPPMKGIHNAYDHMVRSAGLNGQWKTSNFSFFWKENAHTKVLLFFRQKVISSPSIHRDLIHKFVFPSFGFPPIPIWEEHLSSKLETHIDDEQLQTATIRNRNQSFLDRNLAQTIPST